jgi:UDP-glucose 4-epimerase
MVENKGETDFSEQGSRCSGAEVIIVTGASGLIGSLVINKLFTRYRMIGFDMGTGKLPPVESEMVYVDVSSEKTINEALLRIRHGYGTKIASVIHLAAYYDFAGKPTDLYDKITVEGTRKLMLALQDFEVKQFIFSSSLLVYKPTQAGVKIDETSPVLAKWDYPASKVKAEKVLHSERKEIPVVILRIAGVYNEKGSSIPISHHIQRIYEKELTSHFFPGNFSHGSPFVHLDDLIDAIAMTVEKRNELPAQTTINIGEDETLSFEFLQNRIAELIHNKKWKTIRIPKFLAKTGAWVQDIFGDPFIKPWMIEMSDDHMELDISKAKELIGWKPKHSLRDTLPEMIKNLKADPVTWYRYNKLNIK